MMKNKTITDKSYLEFAYDLLEVSYRLFYNNIREPTMEVEPLENHGKFYPEVVKAP